MEVEGKQCFVLNELDKKTKFYKFWNAEYWIRELARKYPKSYHSVYFACCRENYRKEKHTGCYAGPKKHAEETYQAELEAKEAADEAAKKSPENLDQALKAIENAKKELAKKLDSNENTNNEDILEEMRTFDEISKTLSE